jgi:hypothetical protein
LNKAPINLSKALCLPNVFSKQSDLPVCIGPSRGMGGARLQFEGLQGSHMGMGAVHGVNIDMNLRCLR